MRQGWLLYPSLITSLPIYTLLAYHNTYMIMLVKVQINKESLIKTEIPQHLICSVLFCSVAMQHDFPIASYNTWSPNKWGCYATALIISAVVVLMKLHQNNSNYSNAQRSELLCDETFVASDERYNKEMTICDKSMWAGWQLGVLPIGQKKRD